VKAAPTLEGQALFTWSGGKDSALALYEALKAGTKVAALLTTVTKDYGRISMHGVREELLAAQAEAIGLPLEVVYIGVGCSNAGYEAAMAGRLERFRERGVSSVLFGDIFLEDLRLWREERLARLGLAGGFPIWKRDTAALAHRFIDLGFRAVLTCVDTWALPARFCGREFDEALLAELPPEVDPCGERGEFHTFVYAGPILSRPVQFRRGEVVMREGRFCFCDLRPA
jgi:uncharacterized protein (TIGR00290 family)